MLSRTLILVGLLLAVVGCKPAKPSPKTYNLVRAIIAGQLGLPVSSVPPDVTLSRLPTPVDDLDFVEIVIEIEDQFNIEIADEDVGTYPDTARRTMTTHMLATLVERKLATAER